MGTGKWVKVNSQIGNICIGNSQSGNILTGNTPIRKGKRINRIEKVDLVKVEQYKSSRLKGKNKTQSLIDTGVKPENANAHCSDSAVVIRGEEEILKEIDKKGLINKAFNTLENNLSAEKASDRNTAASAILDFTAGKKSEVTNTTPDKIVFIHQTPIDKKTPTENKGIS